jgi:hypothetical protein
MIGKQDTAALAELGVDELKHKMVDAANRHQEAMRGMTEQEAARYVKRVMDDSTPSGDSTS